MFQKINSKPFGNHRNGADDVQNKLYSKVSLIISGLPVFSGVSAAIDPKQFTFKVKPRFKQRGA